MVIMFYIIGAMLAIFSGYNEYGLAYLVLSSLSFSIGSLIARIEQVKLIKEEDGFKGIIKLLLLNTVVYTFITGPLYFIASFIS
jgi:hypothetical protein